MKKTYILGGIAVLGVIAMANNFKRSTVTKEAENVKDQVDKDSTTKTPGSTAGIATTHTADSLLSKGSKGSMVMALQLQMNIYMPAGYTKLKTDGQFGTKTETALQTFWGVKSISYNQLKAKPTTDQMISWGAGKKSTSTWDILKSGNLPGFN